MKVVTKHIDIPLHRMLFILNSVQATARVAQSNMAVPDRLCLNSIFHDIKKCLLSVREMSDHIGMALPVTVLLIADAAMPPTNLNPALPPGNKATM